MATSAGTPGGAYGYSYRSRSGSYSYTAITNHQLTRQRSMPAAVAAAFTSCARGDRPRSLGDGDVDESRGRRAPAARSAPGGAVGAVVRAVLAWIGRGRRRTKAAVAMGLRRSGSSAAAKEQQRYGDEESYAQNFDEGGAAAEPENLSRSFSARYARRAPWRDGAR
ncbi:unnamed protein product [Urochloa decumbens]|uniref:Uncharacterized protein n=1 Tax=Urochloa decumbens TaxID=240449 RepID=A0ABC9CNE2_9POAL